VRPKEEMPQQLLGVEPVPAFSLQEGCPNTIARPDWPARRQPGLTWNTPGNLVVE